MKYPTQIISTAVTFATPFLLEPVSDYHKLAREIKWEVALFGQAPTCLVLSADFSGDAADVASYDIRQGVNMLRNATFYGSDRSFSSFAFGAS